jgi:hypothetical protein
MSGMHEIHLRSAEYASEAAYMTRNAALRSRCPILVRARD